ncbi:hypothetical protein ACLB2K_047053 [Fragaria x ananassa]
MRMRFMKGEQEHVLQGEMERMSKIVNCKSMTRLLRKEKEAVLVQLNVAKTEAKEVEQHSQVKQLLSRYADLFEPPTQLPPHRPQDHQITLLPNASPISVRPYRYPCSQKSEIEKIISELLANGVICPSISPFSSPVLLVKKKDGSWRLCVDYRALNTATVMDKYPILVVDELIDEVHGPAFFTKLDLRSGYHQIQMKEEDIPKTAFQTHSGHYEFLVMPFGLTNAPVTFRAVMKEVLREHLRKFTLVFFDDILVYSPFMQEHLKHLELVFEKLRRHCLKIKSSKCVFAVQQVEYLGHVISKRGVLVDPTKIQCVKQWPQPTTLKQLRGYLGLAGYYRKFVKGFGLIPKPLTDMLKKDGFVWSDSAVEAFEKLKEALMSTPVLAIPDFSKEFAIGSVMPLMGELELF